MSLDRYSHYLSVFRLACGQGGSGRRFAVADAANEVGEVGGEIRSTLEGLFRAGIGPSDFVFLFDTLQKLNEGSVTEVLEKLGATGCKLFAVVPLRYSERLLENGTNENKLVEPCDWWADRLRRYFPASEAIKTPDENDAAFASWPVPPQARAAIETLLPRNKIVMEFNRLRNRTIIFRRTLMRDLYTKADMLDDLKGKSVSVVGNARSLGLTQSGAQIDANDIVVRFNLAPVISRVSHGHRTDWLATSVPLDPQFVENLGAQRVLWMSRYRRKMTSQMLRLERLYIHPKIDVARLVSRAQVERPSTGLMFIDLLAQSTCRLVELYGFDFYKSRSFSGHQTADTAPHAFDREEAFVNNLITRDSRFKICR